MKEIAKTFICIKLTSNASPPPKTSTKTNNANTTCHICVCHGVCKEDTRKLYTWIPACCCCVALCGGLPPPAMASCVLLLGGVNPTQARAGLLLRGVNPPHTKKPCCCYVGGVVTSFKGFKRGLPYVLSPRFLDADGVNFSQLLLAKVDNFSQDLVQDLGLKK